MDVLAVQTSLTLNDQLIAGLRRVAAQLRLIDSDVQRLQNRLNALRVSPGLIGQFNALRSAMGAATMSARQANTEMRTMRVSPVASTTAQTLSRNLLTATTRARALSRAMATMPAAGGGAAGGGFGGGAAPPPGWTTGTSPRGFGGRRSWATTGMPPGAGGGAPPPTAPGGGRAGGFGGRGVHQIFEGVGLGYLAAGVFKGTNSLLEPAKDYAHQLNILKMANIGAKDTADAVQASWENTSKVINTTATGNLAMITDMRGVLSGGTQEAIKMLPIVSKVAAVMASSSEHSIKSNAGPIAFSIAKAMDIMGLNTPAEMEHGAQMLSKVVTAYQNRVDPQAFANTSFYQRQARYGHDDFFRYGVITSEMLERSGAGGGGGSRGIGPQLAAVNRVTNMGIMTKATAGFFSGLGLLHGTQLPTSTTRTLTGSLDNREEWSRNPFMATWQRLVPAMEQKYGLKTEIGEGGQIMNAEAFRNILTQSKMTQNAMSQFMEWVTKAPNVLRDSANVGVLPPIKELPPLLRQIAEKMGLKDGPGALDYEQAYKHAFAADPRFWEDALSAQWKNLRAAMAVTLVPGMIGAMQTVTEGLNSASMWARAHPQAAGAITTGVVGTAGLLGAGLAIQGVVFALRGLAAIPGLAAVGTFAFSAAGGITALAAALAILASRIGESQPETEQWMKKFLPEKLVNTMSDSALRYAYSGTPGSFDWDRNSETARRRVNFSELNGPVNYNAVPDRTREHMAYGRLPKAADTFDSRIAYSPLSDVGAGISDRTREHETTIKSETIERVANVAMTGEATFNGSINVNMGSLGSIIEQAVLKGIIRGSGGAAGAASHGPAHWAHGVIKPPST